MAYYYWNREVEQATRRLGTIAEAIRPITYKETPEFIGAFLFEVDNLCNELSKLKGLILVNTEYYYRHQLLPKNSKYANQEVARFHQQIYIEINRLRLALEEPCPHSYICLQTSRLIPPHCTLPTRDTKNNTSFYTS